MKKTAGILILLFFLFCMCASVNASEIVIEKCSQNIVLKCIDIEAAVLQSGEDMTVIALRKPMADFPNMKAAKDNIAALAQIKSEAPITRISLFYSPDESAPNMYIYVCCKESIAEKTIRFHSREDYIVERFKNETVWNDYPNFIDKYNKSFGYFSLTENKKANMQLFTQTETDSVYKSMFLVRNSFKTVADIEKAYLDAVDAVITARGLKPDNSPAGGGSGGTFSGIAASGTGGLNAEAEFTDLENVLWAKTAINELRKKGIIDGTSKTLFEPNSYIKREDFVKMIIKAKGCTLTDAPCGFYDVTSGSYYERYVTTAANLGIVTGMGNGLFGTGGYLTRQDLAVILYRAFYNEEEKHTENLPLDYDSISQYAQQSVETLMAEGIVNGMPSGRFEPLDNTTRAQTAQLIYRLMLAGKI